MNAGRSAKLKELEVACRANANSLCEEAAILLEAKRYARALFLALCCREELAKEQLVADLRDGALGDDDFRSAFLNHRRKFAYILRTASSRGATDGPVQIGFDPSLGTASKEARERALYVGCGPAFEPSEPLRAIQPDDARRAVESCSRELSAMCLLDLLPGGATTRNALAIRART